MVTSINRGLMSAQVLQLLGISGKGLKNSLTALSSGNRLVQASSDIAAMSIASGLQSQITGMRGALMNVAQASSFLEVADGGLEQAQLIVDRMNALATQANSGALSPSGRKGLDTEFQNLRQELDRLSANTNFNGINLLDGTLSRTSSLQTVTATGASAQGALNFTANPLAGQTVVLNGVTLAAGTDFAIGGTIQQTVSNLASSLNADARFDGFRFSANNGSLGIEAESAGSAGNQFIINRAGSTTSFIASGDPLLGTGIFSLTGGTDAGLSSGDTQAVGAVGNTILAANNGSPATVQARFNSAADIQAGNTLQIDNGQGGFTSFTFVTGAPASSTQIQIDSSLEETLQNAANTLNAFSGAGDFGVRQIDVTTDGSTLTFMGRQQGNVTDVNGTPLDINLTTAGGSLTNAQFNNGTRGGVNLDGVINASFIGTIQGFKAVATGPDQVSLSLTVGGVTYRAQVSDTTPAENTAVRFTSQDGGSFEVTLQGGQGSSVNNQADAEAFASRLDAAFSTLKVTQTRSIEFEGTGSLVGASLEITSDRFSALRVQDVRVSSNLRGNAQLEVVINGESYRVNNLGNTISIKERLTLTSATDPSRTLTFTNGSTRFDLSTEVGAASLKSALEQNLGIPGGEGGRFQIGNNTSETVKLQIGDISSAALLGGRNLSLLTADGAAEALSYMRNAQDYLTAQRADVGAYSQALNYTSAQLESAIQNQDAARAALADADIASESTAYAMLLLQRQAQIATLAQGNRLQGNILQLLGN
jgi:flagellin